MSLVVLSTLWMTALYVHRSAPGSSAAPAATHTHTPNPPPPHHHQNETSRLNARFKVKPQKELPLPALPWSICKSVFFFLFFFIQVRPFGIFCTRQKTPKRPLPRASNRPLCEALEAKVRTNPLARGSAILRTPFWRPWVSCSALLPSQDLEKDDGQTDWSR